MPRKKKKQARKPEERLADEFRLPPAERLRPAHLAPDYTSKYQGYEESLHAPMHPAYPAPYTRVPETFRVSWRYGAIADMEALYRGLRNLEASIQKEKIRPHHWLRPLKTLKRWLEKRRDKKELEAGKKVAARMEKETREVLHLIEEAYRAYHRDRAVMDEFDAREKFFKTVAGPTNRFLKEFNEAVFKAQHKKRLKGWKKAEQASERTEASPWG